MFILYLGLLMVKANLAFQALATDIVSGNFSTKNFVGKNAHISAYAVKSVLNSYASSKYIARKNVKVEDLKKIVANGKTILIIESNKKKLFITTFKATGSNATIYEQ